MSMLAFAGRTLRTLFRDRTAVFFSLFAPLILLVLYVAFFGKITMDAMEADMPFSSRSDIGAFTASWVIAEILAVTTISAPIVGLGQLVQDRSSGRLSDFLVSPLTRRGLMGGYLLATSAYAGVVTGIAAVLGAGYMVLRGYPLPPLASSLSVVGALVVSIVVFSAMSVLIGTFLRTPGAAMAGTSIIATFAGFLAGAYVPPGFLNPGIVTGMNALPFAQSAILIRGGLCTTSLDVLAKGSTESEKILRDLYGMDLTLGGTIASSGWAWGALCFFGVIFFVGAAARARSLKSK